MYHYTECGLANVWLTNGYRTAQTPYGPATAVEDVDGLHRTIALSLTEKKGQIDGQELRFLRLTLKLTQRQLAKLLGSTEQTVSLWERGQAIAPTADMMVRLLVAEKLNAQPKPSHIATAASMVKAIKEKIVASARQQTWGARLAAAQ